MNEKGGRNQTLSKFRYALLFMIFRDQAVDT